MLDTLKKQTRKEGKRGKGERREMERLLEHQDRLADIFASLEIPLDNKKSNRGREFSC